MYKTVDVAADNTRVIVTVGARGYDPNNQGGQTSVRLLSSSQDTTQTTGGGGSNYGWSAAGGFAAYGKSNGGSGRLTFSGTGQGVPSVPLISITPGSGGQVSSGMGGGGGGVIINGNTGPSRYYCLMIKMF